MQGDFISAEKFINTYNQIMGPVGRYKRTISALLELEIPIAGETDIEKVHALEKRLDSIQNDIGEHMKLEEQEVLPILIKHAPEILTHSLLSQHEEISNSISDLRERLEGLLALPSDSITSVVQEAAITEKLGDVCGLIEDHAQRTETIYQIAWEVLSMLMEQESTNP